MCGIVGILKFEHAREAVDAVLLERMRERLRHRGPDGAGLWLDAGRRVGFAHRRLSILDLGAAAAQPMLSPDGRLALTFNGEIYNHAELRRELSALGVTDWRSDHSDTEVLLYAFRHWGIACLSRLRGMFAFGLWDSAQGELWLVRDRIGIKPLYVAQRGEQLAFASEIKALLEDPAQERAVDEDALFHYLSLLASPPPLTLFKGIGKLPGGCWMRVRASGQALVQRYWDVWDRVRPQHGVSDRALAEQVRAALEDAIACHKVSDVPIGVFLSGGIDSSTNAAIFAQGERQPIKTFAIGYAGEYASYRNELHHARAMAARIGAEHHERELGQDDLLAFIPRMIDLQDEPIADPVCVPLYYVAALARSQGVVNCQVGEGADELFIGYPWWARVLKARHFAEMPMPRALRRLALAAVDRTGYSEHYFREMLRRSAAAEPFFFSGAEAFTDVAKHALLCPRLRGAFRGRSSAEAVAEIRARFERGAAERTPENWMSYVDLNFRLPELLLMRVDKMSMGVSLECRVPFLDHRFVELAMSIPSAAKLRHGRLKHILKLAVQGLIPDELINRPKQGFGLPYREWAEGALGSLMKPEIMRFCHDTDLLDAKRVAALLAQPGQLSHWWLFNLAAWHGHFIARRDLAVAA